MTDTDKQILATFSSKVKEQFPCARVRTFGSRARGEAVPDSDFDLCVVLPVLESDTRHRISDIAWEVGFGTGTVLSTVVFSEDDYARRSQAAWPLVRAIDEEGVAP